MRSCAEPDGALGEVDAEIRFGGELAHDEGITHVVEPGGSIKDKAVIAKANEFKMAMIFTGRRHFRH